MQDPFTDQSTYIRGRLLPGAVERGALQDNHERRLEALARLGAAAAECGLRADTDRDLVLLAEDEVSLLESAGGAWAASGTIQPQLLDVLLEVEVLLETLPDVDEELVLVTLPLVVVLVIPPDELDVEVDPPVVVEVNPPVEVEVDQNHRQARRGRRRGYTAFDTHIGESQIAVVPE